MPAVVADLIARIDVSPGTSNAPDVLQAARALVARARAGEDLAPFADRLAGRITFWRPYVDAEVASHLCGGDANETGQCASAIVDALVEALLWHLQRTRDPARVSAFLDARCFDEDHGLRALGRMLETGEDLVWVFSATVGWLASLLGALLSHGSHPGCLDILGRFESLGLTLEILRRRGDGYASRYGRIVAEALPALKPPRGTPARLREDLQEGRAMFGAIAEDRDPLARPAAVSPARRRTKRPGGRRR
jgi:hypothetical protein